MTATSTATKATSHQYPFYKHQPSQNRNNINNPQAPQYLSPQQNAMRQTQHQPSQNRNNINNPQTPQYLSPQLLSQHNQREFHHKYESYQDNKDNKDDIQYIKIAEW